MKDFFRHNGIWVIITALLLTAAISVGSVFLPNLANPIGNFLSVLGTPFRAAADAFLDTVEGMYDYAFRYESMENRVLFLEGQVAELERENQSQQNALEENERLRILLGLSESRQDFVFESATITGRESNSWEDTFIISRGTVHGVEVGQCVITEHGYLVGIVSETGSNWGIVTTIIDPETSIGARVFTSGSTAIITSDLDYMSRGLCRLSYVDSTAEIPEGDCVLTSGISGIYPADLVIGHVQEVDFSSSGMERYAVVEPAADLENLEQVFIIKEFDVVE